MNRFSPPLAAGQLWKMKHVYVQIVELGKRLIEFKLLKYPQEAGVRPQTSEISTLWGYLQARHARLLPNDPLHSP
jgi:hypothetical protein